MKKNVIILTGGLSGSSVLAGLIARGEYWLGDDTKKVKYQTYENVKLVDFNIQILNKSGYLWDDVVDIPPPSIDKIQKMTLNSTFIRCQEFVQQCNDNRPWLWKDPRLCYTIFFWKKYLDVKKCKFILMNRDIRQSWTGVVLRGKMPIAYDKLETIEQNCIYYSKKFLAQEMVNFLAISFEDLILKPAKSISDINEFLGIELSLNDLKSIYKGPLFRLRWSTIDFYKARLKFLYYKYIKRDAIQFPRRKEGRGSGWYHLK